MRAYLKSYFEHFSNNVPTLKLVIFQLCRWFFISAIIGVLIGAAAAFFLVSLEWAGGYRESNRWIILLLPFGGLAIGYCYERWGKKVEAGNNLLIETIHKPQARIPLRMLPMVYLGTIVTHLFGGSAGREGTALQMAGSIADQFSRPFKLEAADRSVLIIAAIAGGFSAVFGTPLAGAVFALEVFFVGKVSYRALFPALCTALIADLCARLLNASHTHYTVGNIPELNFINLLYVIISGVAFGLCASTFSNSLHTFSADVKKTIKNAPLRPFIGGVIIAILIITFNLYSYSGLGISTIVDSFQAPSAPASFILKIALTILTLGFGFKGGEVTPLFFIGATFASALSSIIPLPVGLMAAMGFVAVFAGATNTPLACTLMAIELFGAEGASYFALACVTAYLSSGSSGIYNKQLGRNDKISAILDQNAAKAQDL